MDDDTNMTPGDKLLILDIRRLDFKLPKKRHNTHEEEDGTNLYFVFKLNRRAFERVCPQEHASQLKCLSNVNKKSKIGRHVRRGCFFTMYACD